MKIWMPNDIIKLFRSNKTKTSLFRDEEKNLVPKAQRLKRGQSNVRAWETKDLPGIGKHYGFLLPPKQTKTISIYTPKGGVLKSTFAFNLARMLAINNIKVLVIGLDVQCTITHNLCTGKEEEISSLDQINEKLGLYEIAVNSKVKNSEIEKIILPTDLPTLHYIPESSNLNFLEQRIRDEHKREFTLTRLIEPIKANYDVIIFDNSPNWNFLIQNSLVAATDVISPIACDIETFRSLTQNIEMIDEFKAKMDLHWANFILIPTKVARTKLSTQIEAEYRRSFADFITAGSIRDAVVGQESSLEQLSVIECVPKSPLADDYYEVVIDIWKRINSDTKVKEKNTQEKESLATEA
ncbi:MAG: ParA family protein [Gammaproteobacteria bacterium]|nr:ParA family protein [Gammaproteobacteria bacterium]